MTTHKTELTGLQRGDTFRLHGYEVVARVGRYHDGDLVLLCNNSSHYLIAEVDVAGFDNDLPSQGRLLFAFDYSGRHDNDEQVYREALRALAHLATR